MNLRRADARDWARIRDLLIELGRPDVRGEEDEEQYLALYLAYLSRPDTVAIVAEVEGEIVGFINLEFRQRLNFMQPQAWVPDLIVTESARGKGIGAALLAEVEELARERGSWAITLESAEWREKAHAFYRREGLMDTGRSFSRSLDGSPWPPPPPPAG